MSTPRVMRVVATPALSPSQAADCRRWIDELTGDNIDRIEANRPSGSEAYSFWKARHDGAAYWAESNMTGEYTEYSYNDEVPPWLRDIERRMEDVIRDWPEAYRVELREALGCLVAGEGFCRIGDFWATGDWGYHNEWPGGPGCYDLYRLHIAGLVPIVRWKGRQYDHTATVDGPDVRAVLEAASPPPCPAERRSPAALIAASCGVSSYRFHTSTDTVVWGPAYPWLSEAEQERIIDEEVARRRWD